MNYGSPTTIARELFNRGYPAPEIAAMLGLNAAYVRKIRQRMQGRDEAWSAWRKRNPKKVRSWRTKQVEARREFSAAVGIDRRDRWKALA